MLATKLEFFDCNARIGRPTVWRPGELTTTDEILAEMDYAGISQALVHHSLAAQWSPRDGNETLVEEIAGQDRLFPCFAALPGATEEMPAPAEFAAQVHEAHGAVRLFPKDQQFRFTNWCMADTLGALEARRVPVLIEMGQTTWDDIADVLQTHPGLPVIVLNCYYRMDRYLYPLMDKHANLYLETTTHQVFRGIEDICRRFGHEHLVFGTNLPKLETGGPIAQILYAEISDEAKQAIAGGTLKQLLGL